MILTSEIGEQLKIKPKWLCGFISTVALPAVSGSGFKLMNGEAWGCHQPNHDNKKLDLVGLHCHIGTYIMAAWPYHTAATKLAELAVRLEKKSITCKIH